MHTFAAGRLQRGPRRSQLGNASRPSRRGELAAGLCTILLIAELLLVPVAVLLTLVLVAVSRISRWHPAWLLLPLVAAASWLAAAGPGRALTTVTAGAGTLASGLTHAAGDPARLLHDPGAAATALAWLARELPVGLAAGAIQAGLLAWLSGGEDRAGWRPGLVAAARRWRGRALLAAGQTVTAAGCAIGLDNRTGRLAGFTWAEAERAVLLAGTEPGELSTVAMAVACAAMRRRKTVLALELADDGCLAAPMRTHPVSELAGALGIPVSRVSRPDELRQEAGRAIRARSVVLASGPGGQLTAELTGLLEWLRDRGLRGDTLLCLSGCETVDPVLVAALLALGPPTGTAVLATTTSPACAGALASHAGHTVACGPVSQELAARLIPSSMTAGLGPPDSPENATMSRDRDIRALARQRSGEFTVISADRVRPGGLAVPIVIPDRPGPARRGSTRRAADVLTAGRW